jgi:hypothetical protein
MEHKIRQEIFYRLNSGFDDDLSKFNIELVEGEKIVESAITYFKNTELGWVYPSKSYVVAICYARWISEIWGYDFYQMLNDPGLLFNNDPYFVPYDDSKETYDSIISVVGIDFDQSLGIIPDVRRYFVKEFLLEDELDL